MTNQHPLYLAYTSGSEIVRFEFTPGIYPEDKSEVDGLLVHHVYDVVASPRDYIEHNYYDVRLDTMRSRPSKPNPLALWDTGLDEWTWNHDNLLNCVRAGRDQKLNVCDWTQVPDAQLSEVERNDWRAYRQALRDITQHCDDITCLEDVVWPTEPTGE